MEEYSVVGRSLSTNVGRSGFLLTGSRTTSAQSPPALTSTASSQSRSPSGAVPTSSLNSSSPKPQLQLMTKTALAAVSCENGDRWIITQNITGSLRGLYSNTTNRHKDLNLTTTIPNTPISASCVVISPDQGSDGETISAGLYVSASTICNHCRILYSLLKQTKHLILALRGVL